MLCNQPLELADRLAVAPAFEVRLNPILERGEPELFDSRCFGLREVGIGKVAQGGAAAESKRRLELLRRLVGIASVEGAAALIGEPLEAVEIELVRIDLEDVTGRLRLQHPAEVLTIGALEPFAKLRNVDLQGLSGRVGCLLSPEQIDQPVAGDDLVRMQQQDRE
jgi:hypothetical protein